MQLLDREEPSPAEDFYELAAGLVKLELTKNLWRSERKPNHDSQRQSTNHKG
jgi:hypothetical protein